MSPPRLLPRLLAPAIVLVAAVAAPAGERAHTVRPGESASSLAKKFYGDTDLGDLLLRYNGRSGTVIRAGERLTIPYCDVRRARPGDSWSQLAQRHLGRAWAHSVFAELNGFPSEEPIRVGQSIVVPVVLRHVLLRGETLASLAERFYGDDGKARILQVFNRVQDARGLAVGTRLEIPLVSLRFQETDPVQRREPRESVTTVKKEALPTSSSPTPAPTPAPISEPDRHFEEDIARARRSFTDGDYDRAREILEEVREPVASTGSAWDRRELGRLLAFVYIAFDLDDEACEAYRATLPSPGETDLDPDMVSPRIREALSRCPAVDSRLPGLDRPGSASQIPSHADQGR